MTVHAKYSVFPGRQHYVVVVPPKYQHLFFEGVQSIDATPNVEELNHGQYGYKSDVISEKDFKNVTGTVSCKDFGYMQRVLRSMSGQNPDASFMFDPARLDAVDVFENVFNKARNEVESSKWWVDFNPSVKNASTLDDVETWDFDYTAQRLLTFDGYQIVCQTFADTVANQSAFTLMAPAIVDPVMEDVVVRSASGIVLGNVRHEVCPIQYALRIWVDGNILLDPRDATIITTTVPHVMGGTVAQSVLHLKTPLAKDGQIVKVMWLAKGTEIVSSMGITQAPIMTRAVPVMDNSGASPVWDKKLTVLFNKTIDPTVLAALPATVFTLNWVDTGEAYTWQPSTVAIDVSLSENAVELAFTGTPVKVSDGTAGVNWPDATAAILSYAGNVLKDTQGFVSPHHVLNIVGYTV